MNSTEVKIMAGIVIVSLCFAVTTVVIWRSSHDRDDLRCKQQFGNDYSYTGRTAIDCVNSRGEGKFLRDL